MKIVLFVEKQKQKSTRNFCSLSNFFAREILLKLQNIQSEKRKTLEEKESLDE